MAQAVPASAAGDHPLSLAERLGRVDLGAVEFTEGGTWVGEVGGEVGALAVDAVGIADGDGVGEIEVDEEEVATGEEDAVGELDEGEGVEIDKIGLFGEYDEVLY